MDLLIYFVIAIFHLCFYFVARFFYLVDCAEKKQRRNNNFLLPQVNEFLNLRVILLYFGLSLHFSWISHQFPTDLKPFSCFIILWIQFDRNFILNFCIKPKKNKCISLKTYLVQKIGSSEYETHSVLNDSVSVCLMWPCTMNIWSQFVNIWITVKIAVFMYLEKKKTKSKRIKILNEEEEKKLRFLTRDRSITKKNITRKIVETIKIEAFSKPELCVRNVCFVWIDLNVSHQSGKNSFFSVVHIYTYMFLLLVVYTCGDRLIRVNNWPR